MVVRKPKKVPTKKARVPTFGDLLEYLERKVGADSQVRTIGYELLRSGQNYDHIRAFCGENGIDFDKLKARIEAMMLRGDWQVLFVLRIAAIKLTDKILKGGRSAE